MFRTASLLFAAALAALSACDRAAAGPLVDVAVVDRDSGQWLPQYPHRGDTWVAGEPGHRYAVRLTNTTGQRVLVVLSVDGVNAVTGETADPRQGGYVLDPWESTEITGWRKSLEDVAQFVFTDAPDSYAARTGRPRNVGVIGVAVFRERRPMRVMPAPYPPYAEGQARRESSASAPAAASADQVMESERSSAGNVAAQAQRIGTGHGQREWSPTGTTSFVRASTTPAQVEQIRYDEPRRLAALGILPRHPRHGDRAPQAFPSGFVADPPRW
ncbi:hypothetical protein [Pseudoxanthomonas indica]|uniref:Uncharacterized protein n=1 Tax=Pseudoxanthomonas indica TaxID=428993 RepID=A0A1T5JZA7_9GAMM|nr:hypothetical protein [Pseudoxanthomonas indica]GGD45465.1 hypothetical protein GCM10007235_16710 [Pseudoxanthomonas indica]SKC56635.1 hypothetical protein SAMN06296058_1211 [Pseudoxanthomonas indica]